MYKWSHVNKKATAKPQGSNTSLLATFPWKSINSRRQTNYGTCQTLAQASLGFFAHLAWQPKSLQTLHRRPRALPGTPPRPGVVEATSQPCGFFLQRTFLITVRFLLCVCDRLGLQAVLYSILSLCRVCVGAKRKSGLAAENKGLHAQLYFLLSMVVVQSQCVFAFGLPGDARRKWPF